MDAVERSALKNEVIPFGGVVALGQLLLTIPLAFILNVGQDDAYTLHSTASTIGYAFHEALAFEQNAPLYFVVMALWRHIDLSATFARLFSVLCAAGAVLLIPAIIRRYVGSVSYGWATTAIALNPFLIYTALEIRVYALIVLLSAALLIAFYDAFWKEEVHPASALAYAVLCIISLYTQYYLLFLIAAQGACLLVSRQKHLGRYLLAAACAIAVFAPMAAVVRAQMQNFREGFTAPGSIFASLKVLVAILLRYVIAFEGLPHIALISAAAIAGALAAGIVFRRSLRREGQALLPAITCLATLLFASAVFITHEHVLNRHVALLFLPATLSVYATLTFFREPVRSRLVTCWSLVTIAAAFASLIITYHALAKPGDWIRVNAYLQRRATAGQAIAVFQAENALPLAYYYHGPARIVAIPQGVNFRVYDVTKFVVHDEAQLVNTFPTTDRGVWLINAGGCKAANIDFGCDIVERFVAQHYRIVQTARFYKSTVRFLLPQK